MGFTGVQALPFSALCLVLVIGHMQIYRGQLPKDAIFKNNDELFVWGRNQNDLQSFLAMPESEYRSKFDEYGGSW